MRQAGRYMEEYRRLRRRHGLHEMFCSPQLAAEVTLQPVQAFDLDAAIIFSDILIPLQGMGIELEFTDHKGPIIRNPVRTMAQVEALRIPDPEEDLGFVLQSIRLAREALAGSVPLIGFAGAPFTLASYLIEGVSSRDFVLTKLMMYEEPETWRDLMEKLCSTLGRYLLAQVRAGVQAVQLFDSWVGCLSPGDYRHYVLSYSKKVLDLLEGAGVPRIHFGTRSGELLAAMREAGGEVIGVDWRTTLADAWQRVGPSAGIQGNLDPVLMLAPRRVLEAGADRILDQAAGRPGHIFNLGHGILPNTPTDAVKALIDRVHSHKPG